MRKRGESCALLINPVPRPVMKEVHIRTAPELRRVVFVDTNKPNSIRIVSRARELILARGVESAPIEIKEFGSRPIPEALFERLKAERSLIVLGVGD